MVIYRCDVCKKEEQARSNMMQDPVLPKGWWCKKEEKREIQVCSKECMEKYKSGNVTIQEKMLRDAARKLKGKDNANN